MPEQSDRSLGILSIATNVYLKYWKNLASSIDRHVRAFHPVTLHVFTDQPDEATAFAKTLANVTVVVHEIEPLRWPEATLFRYRIFRDSFDSITEPYVCYLDADTLVGADFEAELADRMDTHGVLLVEQSGSWRPRSLWRFLRFYLLHPGAVVADLRKLVVEGGLGTWERRVESTAFVPRRERTTYVTGAVWMGTREGIRDLVGELSERVQQDWDRDVIAVWHDESHLNWWNATHRPHLLDPRYYFFPGHRHLDELPRIVELIAKDEITR